MRKQVPKLRAFYGEAETEGAMSIIYSDCMSSEHSAAENDPEDVKKHRQQTGNVLNNAYEVRPVKARSKMVSV